MNTLIVEKITWLSVAAAEAEVEISDGTFACVAFSCPCDVRERQILTQPLHAFGSRNVGRTGSTPQGIWNVTEKGLGRRVVGKLVELEAQLVAVGGIVISIDEPLPGGLREGEMIEFECGRIDLW